MGERAADTERERESMLIGQKFLELDFGVWSVRLGLKAAVHVQQDVSPARVSACDTCESSSPEHGRRLYVYPTGDVARSREVCRDRDTGSAVFHGRPHLLFGFDNLFLRVDVDFKASR